MKKLKNSILNLSIVEFVKIFTPLITLPIILSRLSVSEYGVLASYIAIATIASILIDGNLNLGFINRCSRVNIRDNIFQKIFIISFRIRLFILISIILLVSIFPIDRISLDQNLLYFFIISHCIEFFIPIWYYQYIQRLSFISVSFVFSKLITVLLIIIFINNENFLIVYPLSFLIGHSLSLIYTINSARKIPAHGSFDDESKSDLKESNLKNLQELWLFFSRFIAAIYTNLPIITLQYFGLGVQAGAYSIAIRIISPIKTISTPIVNSLYPILSMRNNSNKINDEEYKKINLIKLLTCLASILLSLIIFISIEPILVFLSISDVDLVTNIAKLMCLAPIIIVVGNVYGLQECAAMGRAGLLAICSICSFVIAILLVVFLPKSDFYSVFLILGTEITFTILILGAVICIKYYKT